MPLTVFQDNLPLRENLAIRTTDRREALNFVETYFPGIRATFTEPQGVFEFQLNSGMLAQTQLTAHHQYISGGASFAYQNDPDRLSIEIPTYGSTRIKVGGKREEATAEKSFIVTSPNHEITWEDDGFNYRCLNLHFDMPKIMRYFRLLTGSEDETQLEFAISADVTRPKAKQFLHAAVTPFLSRGTTPGVFDIPASAALYEEFLIHAVLTNLQHNRSDTLDATAASTSSSMVTQCEDYLQEHADTDVTISKIAEHLGVSVRSLQRTFQKEHGTTPMRRLKQIRLERVRARLMNADVGESVTQLAFASGFSHLGAFAADYKKRFGESPSQTLKRSDRQD